MCTKKIKDSSFLGNSYRRCGRAPIKDGLCDYHSAKRDKKLVNWGDRPEYRDITEGEFTRGKYMKLKNSHKHVVYRFHGYKIQILDRFNNWQDTDLSIPYTSFCVKDPYKIKE